MLWYQVLLWVHILGACVLIGTGAGIAFFMVVADRTKDARIVAHVARTVVIADYLFTASAVVIQPVSGILLALETNWPLTELWLITSIGLYVFIGSLWLPVVWMQSRMRALAAEAAMNQSPLPEAYHRLYRLWFAFGIPAFAAILAILWLMIAKPTF